MKSFSLNILILIYPLPLVTIQQQLCLFKKKKKVIKIAHRFITIYVSFFVLLDLTYFLDSSIYLPHLALL